MNPPAGPPRDAPRDGHLTINAFPLRAAIPGEWSRQK
jgi:hypothetical protein